MEKNRPFSPKSPTTPSAEDTATPLRPAVRVDDSIARRGFASMDPAVQQRIAAAGGKASHASGRGHKWTLEEAREAGRKGGSISRKKPSNKATSK